MSHESLTTADRLALHELVASINEHFDAGEIDRFLECFEPGAQMIGSRDASGHEELAAWVRDSSARPPHRHFTTNVVISDVGAPDSASAHSSWIYLEWTDGTLHARMGTYVDTLVKRANRWRVTRRQALYDWSRSEPMAALTRETPEGGTHMIKLVFCLMRRPELSDAEFRRRWREHADLVAKRAPALGIRRYVQVHTLDSQLNEAMRAPRKGPAPYDGVAELWWEDLDAVAASTATPEGLKAARDLIAVEARFIDFARSPIFIAEEREYVSLSS